MKKFFTTLTCLVFITAQILSLAACKSSTDKTNGNETSEDVATSDIGNDQVTPTVKPVTSKDPADYEIPTGLSSSFSIVCVSYQSLEKTHFIDAFLSDDGNYYLILPSAVDLSNVALYFHVGSGSVKIGDENINDKISFFDFSETGFIEFQLSEKTSKTPKTVKLIVQTSAVPVVYLDVDESLGTIRAMQTDKEKNTHAYGVMYLDSADDSHDLVSYFDIHGHGNSTWKASTNKKQPYNIKFTEDDSYDNGRKVRPLGMRANSKWCLLSDASEESFLRTRVAHYLGEQVGIDYAIQCRYTNLYLGSEYIGAYYLIERAINVEDALDLELATGDNMDGSWIFEFDNHKDPENQFKVNGATITVKSRIDGCEYNALQKYLNEVSVALNNSKGYNKATGKYYYDYIDLESFAEFLLVREFTLDYDLVASVWMYYDAVEDKVNAGPLWDFDNSMWTCAGQRGHMSMYKDTDKLLVMQDDKSRGCWLVELMKFKKFTDALKEKYNEFSYLFDLKDERCIYNVYEGWFDEGKHLAQQNDLRWNTLVKTAAIKGYEYDGSAYAPYYGQVANFLYDRCRDYGTALEKYANGTR